MPVVFFIQAAAEMQSTSALENTAAEPNTEEIDFHLELQRRVPEGINSITACMASDDITVWMLILAISIGVFALELWKLFKDSAKRLECVSLK